MIFAIIKYNENLFIRILVFDYLNSDSVTLLSSKIDFVSLQDKLVGERGSKYPAKTTHERAAL